MLESLSFHAVQALGTWQTTAMVLLIVPLLTNVLTTIKSVLALYGTGERKPPILPYWLPLIGNLIPFARDTPKLASDVT